MDAYRLFSSAISRIPASSDAFTNNFTIDRRMFMNPPIPFIPVSSRSNGSENGSHGSTRRQRRDAPRNVPPRSSRSLRAYRCVPIVFPLAGGSLPHGPRGADRSSRASPPANSPAPSLADLHHGYELVRARGGYITERARHEYAGKTETDGGVPLAAVPPPKCIAGGSSDTHNNHNNGISRVTRGPPPRIGTARCAAHITPTTAAVYQAGEP